MFLDEEMIDAYFIANITIDYLWLLLWLPSELLSVRDAESIDLL
jgi:hypothetical protein